MTTGSMREHCLRSWHRGGRYASPPTILSGPIECKPGVPWRRDALHESRSAAPAGPGARSAHICDMQATSNAAPRDAPPGSCVRRHVSRGLARSQLLERELEACRRGAAVRSERDEGIAQMSAHRDVRGLLLQDATRLPGL